MAQAKLTKNNIEKISFLKNKGFKELPLCFRLLTNNFDHRVYLHDDESVQISGYHKEDTDSDPSYDTGLLHVINNQEFKTLVTVLVDNNI